MSISPPCAIRLTRPRSSHPLAALSLLLLSVLLASQPAAVALTLQEQCLLEGSCVDPIPDRLRSDTPRDAEGYTYKTCNNFYGRNYPCRRRFGGVKTWDEYENLEDAVAYYQNSLDSQAACWCSDDVPPVASLASETPWSTPETLEEDRCANPDRPPLLPKFYNGLFETRGQRSFLLAQKCAQGELIFSGYGAIQRQRAITCPAGSQGTSRGCERTDVDPLKALGQCTGPATPRAGNPVDVASGNQYERELDYLGAGPAPLRFERHYNSHVGTTPGDLGQQWRHTYERTLIASGFGATYIREDGKVLYFTRQSSVPESPWRAVDADVVARLQDAAPGTLINDTPVRLLMHTGSDAVEAYGQDGRLLTITTTGGFRTELSYDEWGHLQRVSNPFGRSLEFIHDRGRLAEMIDPAGRSYRYRYDEAKLLASVSYPSPQSQLWQRQYLYADPDHPVGLTQIINERGLPYAAWDYDDQGRAVLSEHAGGADRTVLAYLGNGDVEVTDALGNRSRFTFETTHHLRRKTGESSPCATCGGRSAAITYDPATGFRDVVTDFNGIQTDHDVDARGLESRRVEALGTEDERAVDTQWHALLRKPTRVEAAHAVGGTPEQVTRFLYNEHGQLLSRTLTDTGSQRARTTTWSYTDGNTPGVPAGLLASVDGPRTDLADITRFTYHPDGSGNLHTLSNALDHVTRYTDYDAHGRPTRWVDANGLITTASYDERGRLTQQVSDGRITGFDHDAAGNRVRMTAPDGNTLTYHYDDANRLVHMEDAEGNRIRYVLDAAGNHTAEHVLDTQGSPRRTAGAVFDGLGRLRQRIEGESQAHAYLYDEQGNLTTYTDPMQRPTVYAYDALNRLRTRTATDEGETGFEYDARDNLTRITDPRGLAARYLYSGLDERIEERSADSGTTLYDHDLAGNVLSRTDARGIVVTFTYDALGRITERRYPDATENVRFTYDTAPNGIGRLASVVDPSGTTAFEYDRRGNLRAEHRNVGGSTYTTRYTYDDLDRRVGMLYPSGREVVYARNLLGQITDVTLNDHGTQQVLASGIEHEPFGPRQYLERGNGLTEQRTYDLSARLLTLSSAPAMQRSYEYDSNNNIQAILELNDPDRDQRFTYDAASRLTGAEGTYGVLGYTYDEMGNRLSRTDNGTPELYTYEGTSNRLRQIAGPGGTPYQYDALGNTVARGAQTLSYNDAGRLEEVDGPAGRAAFVYNAFGQRVTRNANDEQTGFIFDSYGMLIAEVHDDGDVRREYVYLDEAPFVIMDAQGEVVTGYRVTGAATETLPSLDLTLDVVNQTIALDEGVNPPRVLTEGVTIGEDVDGRTTASAPLPPEGWLYLALADPAASPPQGDSVVVVYDPPEPEVEQLYGLGDGTQPEITMTVQGTTVQYQMTVDPDDRVIQLKQDEQVVQAFNLQDANWVTFSLPQPAVDYLVVTEDTPERLVFLWMAKNANDAQYRLAGLTLREGYVALRVHLSPAVAPLTTPRPANTLWYHTDQLGTPIALTDASGAIAWHADYMPFGRTQTTVEVDQQQIRFPGQYEDETGAGLYNYHRYYDPSTGRYLRSDPIGLNGGINTYAYVGGNPLNRIDPTGEFFFLLIPTIPVWAAAASDAALLGALAYGLNNNIDGTQDSCNSCDSSPPATLNPDPCDFFPELCVPGNQGGRPKPVNLPSSSKVQIDMEHVLSGHVRGGHRVSAKKTLFPDSMNSSQIRRSILRAYKRCKRVESQGTRIRAQGTDSRTGLSIEMWIDTKAGVIETAYPMF